ncbi:hypothetical protein FBU30_011051 [Linnemannia zychae]|nr:hypothetical protein FBU30_011051 [Linnemannia zychae]
MHISKFPILITSLFAAILAVTTPGSAQWISDSSQPCQDCLIAARNSKISACEGILPDPNDVLSYQSRLCQCGAAADDAWIVSCTRPDACSDLTSVLLRRIYFSVKIGCERNPPVDVPTTSSPSSEEAPPTPTPPTDEVSLEPTAPLADVTPAPTTPLTGEVPPTPTNAPAEEIPPAPTSAPTEEVPPAQPVDSAAPTLTTLPAEGSSPLPQAPPTVGATPVLTAPTTAESTPIPTAPLTASTLSLSPKSATTVGMVIGAVTLMAALL